MTAPAMAARYFGLACLLGAGLGLVYGFLRPLRPRFTLPADGIFLLALFWAWLYLSFGICGGDLRLGYAAGLAAGGFLWEATLGKTLRPVFRFFWKFIGYLWRITLVPLKIFFEKSENFVCICRKMGYNDRE